MNSRYVPKPEADSKSALAPSEEGKGGSWRLGWSSALGGRRPSGHPLQLPADECEPPEVGKSARG
jgi:hypothetical protein